MSSVIITGATGLIGSEAAAFYAERGHTVVGIDNDMRRHFFGDQASTRWRLAALAADYPQYIHHDIDVRDRPSVERVFAEYGRDIALVLHAAGQPSHDWAAGDPHTDFSVNAIGTLTVLEAARQFCPESPFVFASTNKVYGDRPNDLPLFEDDTRWEIEPAHPYWDGIDETMSIDASTHSLFGVSKGAADLLVQEYGRFFGMRTACFRGGCLTGPNHSGVQLHGFLSHLMRCVVDDIPYTVFGHRGKQVRDNIHSYDYVTAVEEFRCHPRCGEVYNIGGGRFCSCSVLEAIELCEEIAGKRLRWRYVDAPRKADHVWWISNTRKLAGQFPSWHPQYDLRTTLEHMLAQRVARWV